MPDTGSGQLNLLSSSCQTYSGSSCPVASGAYNIWESSTAVIQSCTTNCACVQISGPSGYFDGCKFSYQYDAGTFNGYIASDTVSIGDLVLTQQPIGVVFQDSVSLILDGVLGLGPDNSVNLLPPSFLTSLVDQIGYPDVFTVSLDFDGGSIYFGGIDPTITASLLGEILIVPPTQYYSFNIESIVVATPQDLVNNIGYIAVPDQVKQSFIINHIKICLYNICK
jgi:hypothetical protein